MSYLKSSLYYLKDINDFLDEKRRQYKDLSNYAEELKKNSKEIMPFLERVTMNVHNFNLVKERYMNDVETNVWFRKCIIAILYIVAVVLWLSMLYNCYKHFFKGDEKWKIIIGYTVGILFANMIMDVAIKSQQNRLADYQGSLDQQFPVEKVFTDLDRPEGVAMYYALKRAFSEPDTSSNKKTIKTLFETFVETREVNNKKIKIYPSIKDIIPPAGYTSNIKSETASTLKTAWVAFVNTCKSTLENNFQEIIPNSTQTRSLYSKIDKQISYSSGITLLKELKTQGSSIRDIVGNKVSPNVGQLGRDDIIFIIENEIVPVFNVSKEMHELSGIRMKTEGVALSLVEPEKEFANEKECMFNCEINDACMVSAFNIPTKKCSLYKNKVSSGDYFNMSNDDITYVKSSDSNVNIYLKAGKMKTQPSDNPLSSTTGGSNCTLDCISNAKCVMIEGFTGSNCKMSFASSNIDLDNIVPTCNDDDMSPCFLYKKNVNNVGVYIDPNNILQQSKEVVVKKLVSIMKKYKYEFSLEEHSQLIKETLRTKLPNDVYSNIEDTVNEILSKAESSSTKAKDTDKPGAVPKYISKTAFVDKLNNMTYRDLGSLYYSIDTLKLVVNDLNDMVQKTIANNISAENNIFLAQERQQNINVSVIVHISLLAILAFVYYSINWYFKGKWETVNGLGNKLLLGAYQIILPLIFVILLIILIVSWNYKTTYLNSYNKEVLEKNGGSLVSSINDMYEKIQTIQNIVVQQQKRYSLDTLIKDLNIPLDNQNELFDSIITSLELLEKCNLLTEGSDITLPFPWTDISFNIIICFVSVSVLLFLIGQMNPMDQLKQIRELTIALKKLMSGIPINLRDIICSENSDEMETTLKIIAVIIFVIMGIMFGVKLMQSASDYKAGLYNSKYFEESKCAS
jgi:hypothetical protein